MCIISCITFISPSGKQPSEKRVEHVERVMAHARLFLEGECLFTAVTHKAAMFRGVSFWGFSLFCGCFRKFAPAGCRQGCSMVIWRCVNMWVCLLKLPHFDGFEVEPKNEPQLLGVP